MLTEALAEGRALRRDEVEPTVTEGYARALALDAECLRIERRIDELTHDSAVVGYEMPRGELATLFERLQEATRQSTELRELLAPLRKVIAEAA